MENPIVARSAGHMGYASKLFVASFILTSIYLLTSSTILIVRGEQSAESAVINSNLSEISIEGSPHLGDKNNIPVNIRLEPAHYLHGKTYIATGAQFNATAEILDDKFKDLIITYQWSTRNTIIATGTNRSRIEYKFDKADPETYLKVIVFSREKEEHSGVSEKSIIVRDPIKIAEPVDKLFIEHGELLNITLKFSGTGPFVYCYQLCLYSCHECYPIWHLNENQYHIVKYLHNVGNYTLRFAVDNIVSHQNKSYSVRVIDTPRESTVPYMPIVCSMSAVLILLIGFALHLKFNSISVYTETADFDFTRTTYNESAEEEDLWDEEQSFMQRVNYLLFKSNTERRNSSMAESNTSERSRLI